LIDREQGKVVENAKLKMSAGADLLGFNDWDSLYGIDEQMARVLGRVLKVALPDRLPENLPGQLRDPYEDAADVMLPQHPFLSDTGFAGVVFEEFLCARALREGPDWLRDAVRRRLRQPEHLPSPLLGYFMLEARSDNEIPVIYAEDVGILFNSLQSGAQTFSGRVEAPWWHSVMTGGPVASGWFERAEWSGRDG